MVMRIKTIYEIFGDYTEREIDFAISQLGYDERLIVKSRYGNDLHHPKTMENWNQEKSSLFYRVILRKIEKLLINNRHLMEENVKLPNIDDFTLSDNMVKLMELLSDGSKVVFGQDICAKLGIDNREFSDLLRQLRIRGVNIERKYYANGSVKYSNVVGSIDDNSGSINIAFANDDKSVKVLAISDLHFGNQLERLDLVDRAFNYCKKNGINIILCCGDFIDGAHTMGAQYMESPYKQIKYFLNNYPIDDNILTFGCAGNHDMDAYASTYFDFVQLCSNYRNDIILGGYNEAEIKMKNQSIKMFHQFDKSSSVPEKSPLVLCGHTHKFKVIHSENGRYLRVVVPTLSNIMERMPSALELDINFYGGVYMNDVLIKHVYFDTSADINLGEVSYEFPKIKGRRK